MTTDASKLDELYEPVKEFKPLKRSVSSLSNGSTDNIKEEMMIAKKIAQKTLQEVKSATGLL